MSRAILKVKGQFQMKSDHIEKGLARRFAVAFVWEYASYRVIVAIKLLELVIFQLFVSLYFTMTFEAWT